MLSIERGFEPKPTSNHLHVVEAPDGIWGEVDDWEPKLVDDLSEYLQTVASQLQLPVPLYQCEDYSSEIAFKRKPFAKQAEAINALCKQFLSGGKAGFLMAETGTGKSLMGTAVLGILANQHKQKMAELSINERRPFHAVIVAPPHLIDDSDSPVASMLKKTAKSQWREEIENTMPKLLLRYEIIQIKGIETLMAYQEKLNTVGVDLDLVIFLLTPSRLRGCTPFRGAALPIRFAKSKTKGKKSQLFAMADFPDPQLPEGVRQKMESEPYWPAHLENLIGTISNLLNQEKPQEVIELAKVSPSAMRELLSGKIRSTLGYKVRAVLRGIPESTDAPDWKALWKARLEKLRKERPPVEVFCCPRCGRPLMKDNNDQPEFADAKWLSETFRFHKECAGKWIGPFPRVEADAPKTATIRTPLWSMVPRAKTGRVRWPIGVWLSKSDLPIDLAVFDEAHLFKAATSAQGHGFRLIAGKAKHTLAMTGTPTGGYASTIFTLLHTLSARFRQDYKFEDVTTFSRTYGIWERTIKIDHNNDDRNNTSKGNTNKIIMKERPGISGLVLKNYLLEIGVPLLLLDIDDITMPPMEQYEHIVELDPEEAAQVMNYTDQIADAFVNYREYAGKIASAALQTQLVCSDLPFRDYSIEIAVYDATKRQKHVIEVAKFEAVQGIQDENGNCQRLLPKERQVLELLKYEKSRGRKVMVYVCHSGKYDYIARFRSAVDFFNEEQGENLRVAGFYSTPPAGMTAWKEKDGSVKNRDFHIFADAKNRKAKLLGVLPNADAVIINAKAVETGLNLREFPTLVYLEMPYSVGTFRQSAARSWRPGQTKNVDVHVFINAGTLQMAALTLVAAKLAQDNRIRGELNMGRIEESAMGDDLYYQLSKVIRGELSVSQLGKSNDQFKTWQHEVVAEIQDVPEILAETGIAEILTESRFEQMRIKRKGKPEEFVLQGTLF
jgi:hypothetical protein